MVWLPIAGARLALTATPIAMPVAVVSNAPRPWVFAGAWNGFVLTRESLPSPSSTWRLATLDPPRCRGAAATASWCCGVQLFRGFLAVLLLLRSLHYSPIPPRGGGWRSSTRWLSGASASLRMVGALPTWPTVRIARSIAVPGAVAVTAPRMEEETVRCASAAAAAVTVLSSSDAAHGWTPPLVVGSAFRPCAVTTRFACVLAKESSSSLLPRVVVVPDLAVGRDAAAPTVGCCTA